MAAPSLLQPAPLPARLPDWRARLAVYLAEVAPLGFRPGRHDCALFGAGGVKACTGIDPAKGLRGRYRSLARGQELLQAAGFADHVALAAAWCPEIPPAFAQVGDLALLPSDEDGGALGIVQGEKVYILQPSGLSLVSRLHIQRAFRV